MNNPLRRPLRVVQVSFHSDVERRDADALLAAWPTIPAVANAVARTGVEVTVVQAAHRDEKLERDGITYRFLDDDERRRTRVVSAVAALAPDVVHVRGFHHGSAVERLTRSVVAARVLVQDHGARPPSGWRRHAWRWALRGLGGAAFTCTSQAGVWFESGVLNRRVPVFPVLGGSSAFTPGDRGAARRTTGLFGDPCLLWTGRLDANKDPLTMLDAVERAARALPELRLWCCFGNAPLLDAVRARIASSPVLAERTSLVGTRPHRAMEAYHRAADFYLQTSRREASGFSLLEALACGTTPLVTDIPAARRIVGACGSLTPVGDSAALGRAIVEWARRDRNVLRREAREHFERSLTFGVIGRELRSAYESLALQ